MEAHGGRWGHADWLALLDTLRHSPFWPLNPDAVGTVLEQIQGQDEWRNLRRWQQSGEARRWVEARQGQWGHQDWLALLDTLRQSDFWPLDPGAVGEVLRGLTEEWWHLRRWRVSGLARRWVKARQGRWGPDDWPALEEELRRWGFWPVNPDAVAWVLEAVKAEWCNLRRWQQSGEPRRWLEAGQGQWGPQDWTALLEALRQSEFWPLEPAAVRVVIDGMRSPPQQAA